MKLFYKVSSTFVITCVALSALAGVSYAFPPIPTIGNFGDVHTVIQSDSHSGNSTVTGNEDSNANNNIVQSGNSNNSTTVCTSANSNGVSPCIATPTSAQPTPTTEPIPTPTPGQNNGGGGNGGGGGSSSNNSSGSSSNSSSGPAVLGASTFAGTGTFTENTMNGIFILGSFMLFLSGLSYTKEKTLK